MIARRIVGATLLVTTATLLAACGGDEAGPEPVVDWIDDAISLLEAQYGEPQEYFEISADLERVTLIVAVDDATAAESAHYDGDGAVSVPEPVGAASGTTFTAAAIEFEPGEIFDTVRRELADPVIVDFAIVGAPGDAVVYDATVIGDLGGVLLVQLGSDGSVLAVQAE